MPHRHSILVSFTVVTGLLIITLVGNSLAQNGAPFVYLPMIFSAGSAVSATPVPSITPTPTATFLSTATSTITATPTHAPTSTPTTRPPTPTPTLPPPSFNNCQADP